MKAEVTEKDRALLEYVRVLTLEPGKVSDKLVESLRKVGFTDEQIFEASFVASLFAFFNRMADAYGLDYPSAGWMPVEERAKRGLPMQFRPQRPPAPPPMPKEPEKKDGAAKPDEKK